VGSSNLDANERSFGENLFSGIAQNDAEIQNAISPGSNLDAQFSQDFDATASIA
jgi:hypothetical protein